MFVSIEKITGFECSDRVVEILDDCNKPFYFLLNEQRKRITFNLPPGDYYFLCDAKRLKRPLTYEAPPLPAPEKKDLHNVVEDITIIVEHNPNKASFERATGKMIIDESFISKPKPQRRFVMGHELGHNYYKSEDKCDYYSAFTMLQEGYNPSQCYYSNTFCLSDKQKRRKEKLFNLLKKVKCYE